MQKRKRVICPNFGVGHKAWVDAGTRTGTRARTRAVTGAGTRARTGVWTRGSEEERERAPRLRNMQKMRVGIHPAWGIPSRR